MRVLHINSTIGMNSGVMSVIMNYYRHIDNNLVQFDFLYFLASKFGIKTYEDEIVSYGGKVYFINDLKRIFDFNNRLNQILQKNDYKTVQIHDPFVTVFIYKTLRKNGIKNIIVHSHATKWSDKTLNGIRNRILCMNLNKYMDYKFACSKAAGDFLYGNKQDYIVMNNAIELEKYRFNRNTRNVVRKRLGISDNLVFGHVGNFCKQKNHLFLIRIFKRIKEKNSHAILLLIGEGPLRENIELKVQEYGLENSVFFLGKRIDVEDFYQAMDCFILPSLYEGLPMVGVEAQCAGLPILFSDTITREIATDDSAFMSLNESDEKWAKKALELCTHDINRVAGIKKLSEMGFDIEKEAKKIQNVYLNLID